MVSRVRAMVVVGGGAVLLRALPVVAAEGGDAGNIKLQDPLGGATFGVVLQKVLSAATLIAAPILALMVVVGGFQIMSARDNKEAALKGRQTLYNAMIGFAVIIVANSVGAIVRSLVGSK